MRECARTGNMMRKGGKKWRQQDKDAGRKGGGNTRRLGDGSASGQGALLKHDCLVCPHRLPKRRGSPRVCSYCQAAHGPSLNRKANLCLCACTYIAHAHLAYLQPCPRHVGRVRMPFSCLVGVLCSSCPPSPRTFLYKRTLPYNLLPGAQRSRSTVPRLSKTAPGRLQDSP